MNLYQPTITGSLSVSGSVNISGSITIAGGGTISGTASIATTALTASSADNLLVRNTLTAQTLVVQTITSSVDFVTGSTRFGSIAANTHNFTGSVLLSGSFGLNKAVPQRQYTQVANANGIVFTIQNASASNEGYIVGFDSIGSTYLQLSDSTNAARVYLNSSGSSYFTGGNVGIGTNTITNGTAFGGATQINTLKIVSPNYTALEINSNTSGGSLQFTYGTNLPNQVGALIGYNYASGASLEFSITNVTNGPLILATSGSERMRISSTGVVTKPFQPLAMGGMAENQSVAATTFTSIAFNTSYGFNQANVGSCWNNSTSTFTAPATGVYLINAALFTSNVGQIAAFINGTRTISMVSTTGTFPTTWHGTLIVKLTSGDALTLRGYGDASGVITQNTYHTWFGIYFLG